MLAIDLGALFAGNMKRNRFPFKVPLCLRTIIQRIKRGCRLFFFFLDSVVDNMSLNFRHLI